MTENLHAYVTYSDGSESGGGEAWGIACAAHDAPDEWIWVETLDLRTATATEALAEVHARGWTAERVPGGWYGDERDRSYRLTRSPDGPA